MTRLNAAAASPPGRDQPARHQPLGLKARLLNRLGYLPNVAVGILEIGRSYAPGLIRRVLKEVDTPPGQICMEGIDIVGEGG
jgi:hypothetical protein